MSAEGWYTTEAVEQTKLNQAKNKFQKLIEGNE